MPCAASMGSWELAVLGGGNCSGLGCGREYQNIWIGSSHSRRPDFLALTAASCTENSVHSKDHDYCNLLTRVEKPTVAYLFTGWHLRTVISPNFEKCFLRAGGLLTCSGRFFRCSVFGSSS